MWFEQLTGFREESPEQVRQHLSVAGEKLVSHVNGNEYTCGSLETPTLAELRERVANSTVEPGTLRLAEVVGDVGKLHADPASEGALFQVASQFNLLEMVSPSVTPEAGVDRYEFDHTQGPACAIACGAGTIYRNYFAEVEGLVGQSSVRQIDCLAELGAALGNKRERLWVMRNGYALATAAGLRQISDALSAADETTRDQLRATIRIGVQWNTQVTVNKACHTVTQAYCSAMPVAYSSHSADLWAPLATLVLEAAYEATLLAAILNTQATGNPRVYFTLLGGGAFGNHDDWIFAALERALRIGSGHHLIAEIVSYGRSKPRVQQLIASLEH